MTSALEAPVPPDRTQAGGAVDQMSRWRILLDFGRIALEDLEVQSLLQRAVAQVSRGTGIRHAKVARYRPEHGDLLVEAGVGWKPGVVGRARFALDASSPPGRCVLTGQPVIVEDLRGNPAYRTHATLAEHNLVAVANVPISFNAKIWGVLEVDSARPGALHQADVEFLEGMSHLLAGGLQRAEAQAQAQAQAAEAAGMTARHAMLLQELRHRAKNNLQLVVSILARERRALESEMPKAAERFGRAMDRVAAIAIAHDRLSADPAASGLEPATDLAGYLRALCASLQLSLEGRLLIEADLEQCGIPFDRTVAVGLIVNELVTNAAKHAYPEDQEGGIVRVTLRSQTEAAEVTLTVSDEGSGPASSEANRRDGQGLSLVRLLARQLGGQVEDRRPTQGTAVIVRFPLVA